MNKPSKFAVECADLLLPHRKILSSPIAQSEVFIQEAIDQACAEKDSLINDYRDEITRLVEQSEKEGKRIAELELDNKHHCSDWAEEDTHVKALAKPFIGDLEEKGLGFRGVVEVTEALVDRILEMAKLLDDVEHRLGCPDYHSQQAKCPRCAWEKLKCS